MRARTRYEGYLILSAFLWGTSFVAIKVGVDHVDPILFSMVRFIIGSAFLLALTYITSSFDRRVLGDRLIWVIAFINAIAHELQHVGVVRTTATNAVLLVDINVIFVALLAVMILGERITRRLLLGLVLGLVGVLVITTSGEISSVFSGSFIGNAMVFSSGVLWAFYIVYQKKVLGRQVNVLMVTASVVMITTLFLVPMTLLFATDYSVNGMGAACLLYTGILSTGAAFLLYNAGLRVIGATASSLILLLEIVFGMMFAYLLLTETPTPVTVVGGALIILAIVVISIKGKGLSAKLPPD